MSSDRTSDLSKQTHPASRTSPTHSRASSSASIDALPAALNSTGGSSTSSSLNPVLTSSENNAANSPITPSPLRAETTESESAAPGSSVTFSVPSHSDTSSMDTRTASGEPSSIHSKSLTGSQVPSQDTLREPPPLHSILKPSPISSSRRSSVSDDVGPHSGNLTDSPRGRNALLQLPDSGTPSSIRSASPTLVSDRTRIVGKGGYGGRRGGPALDQNRTSSSGGLSDVDMKPGYERKVGFDTMIDADDTPNGYFTFCLQVKSRGYKRTKNTRTFMCAVDDNGYSERALEWLMESLVSDGDEIVALRVLEGDPDEIDQEEARDDARELMASIVELNDEYGDRSISIVVEFVAGRVTSTILGLIYMYRPDSLTVGTRGRSVSAIQKMFGNSFMGSCSRDILNRSPVPVVIVRPEAKVKKHLAKRQNDPKRRSYHDLVALSKNDNLPLSVGTTSKRHSRILPK